MHDAAIRVGSAHWRDWLLSVADTRSLRRLELPGDVLEAESAEVMPLLAHLRLVVLHVPDALPPTLGRYASETGLTEDAPSLDALVRGLRPRLRGGVRVTSVDLGLDRLSREGFEEGLRHRAHLLRRLIHELEPMGVAVAVRVRYPRPFSGSHEREWAGNLLHELTGERCYLAVDVAMPDLAEAFEPEDFLRDCSSHLALLRLHFRWGWGESPDQTVWERWGAALRRHSGSLGLVLCPQELPLGCAKALLADVERWAGLLTGSGTLGPVRSSPGGPAKEPPPARSPE